MNITRKVELLDRVFDKMQRPKRNSPYRVVHEEMAKIMRATLLALVMPRFCASKSSPFFQSISTVAAILRASVRRAMVGLMPFASEAW